MAEQIFIIEGGTLTKFECDDYVQEVYIPNCVKRIGCRELQFLPYWDPVPFADVPSSYTENQAVKPNDTQKIISGVITNT